MSKYKDTTTVETICKKIDKNIALVKDRGLLAQNIVGSLRHLVEAVSVYIYNVDNSTDLRVEYIDNSIKTATDYIRTKGRYKFLSDFYAGVQVSISHYVPTEDEAIRLMQKYYYSLVDLKQVLERDFNVSVLNSIYDYPISMDSTYHDYYEKIIPLIEQCSNEIGHLINGRYYVQKVKPILWNRQFYYEVTLCSANDKTSKFDRIIVFSKKRVSTNYAIKAELINLYTTIFGKNMLVRVMTNWVVSIRPCEINNYARIFGLSYRISGRYKEYQAIMNLLTNSKIDLLDICIKNEPDIELAYQSIDSTYIKPLLEKSRKIIRNCESGANILRYLLFTMRNKVIKSQLKRTPCEKLSGLYLKIGCDRFDKIPFVMGLEDHVPLIDDLLRCIETTGKSDELFARRIISNSENHGALYTSVNDIIIDEGEDLQALINNYNDKQYPTHQGNHLVEENRQVYIRSYERDCISIIERLNKLSEESIEDYYEYASKWIEDNNPDISEDKKNVLKSLFSNSRVALLYGAAGTGKTTLIKCFSKMFEGSRILFLAPTHTALNNLKRQTYSINFAYETIRKYVKTRFRNYYDILIIDECSATNNSDISNILTHDVFEKVLLVGDTYQLESINFGNWFMLARELMNRNTSFELELIHRTSNGKLLKLWDLVRNEDKKITDYMSKNEFNYPINEELLKSYDKDEIILCLVYDGLFGINNINSIMQSKESGKSVDLGISRYKVNDPIVFNESKIYGDVLYNNLKGKIADINDQGNRVYFEIELEIIVNSEAIENAGAVYISDDGKKSKVGLYVNKMADTDEDDMDEMVVPFSVAYAMSVYKAQGLEYNSVKVVIPNDLEEMVTPNMFYTAITRAKQSLRIYWSPETQQRIIGQLKFAPDNKVLSIIRNKLKNREL